MSGDTTAFGGDNAESYYDDGLTASMKGDLERAITCFEKAIHLDRSLAAAYHQIAKCYLRLGLGRRAVDDLHVSHHVYGHGLTPIRSDNGLYSAAERAPCG